MSIEVPEGLQWVSYLAGSAWPGGDEEGLFGVGERWREVAAGVGELVPQLEGARRAAVGALAGETAAAAQEQFGLLFDGHCAMGELVEAMGALGELAREGGGQVESGKLQILVTLAIAAAEILYAMAMSGWTFGGSMAWIPVIEALTVTGIRMVVARLTARLTAGAAAALTRTGVRRLVRHVGVEVVQEGVTEGVTSGVIAGYEERKRDIAIDYAAVGRSVVAGGAGGAGGAVGHKMAARGLGEAGSKIGKVTNGVAAHGVSGIAGGLVGAGAGGGPLGVEILSGATTQAASGGLHGGGGHGDAHGHSDDHRNGPEGPLREDAASYADELAAVTPVALASPVPGSPVGRSESTEPASLNGTAEPTGSAVVMSPASRSTVSPREAPVNPDAHGVSRESSPPPGGAGTEDADHLAAGGGGPLNGTVDQRRPGPSALPVDTPAVVAGRDVGRSQTRVMTQGAVTDSGPARSAGHVEVAAPAEGRLARSNTATPGVESPLPATAAVVRATPGPLEPPLSPSGTAATSTTASTAALLTPSDPATAASPSAVRSAHGDTLPASEGRPSATTTSSSTPIEVRTSRAEVAGAGASVTVAETAAAQQYRGPAAPQVSATASTSTSTAPEPATPPRAAQATESRVSPSPESASPLRSNASSPSPSVTTSVARTDIQSAQVRAEAQITPKRSPTAVVDTGTAARAEDLLSTESTHRTFALRSSGNESTATPEVAGADGVGAEPSDWARFAAQDPARAADVMGRVARSLAGTKWADAAEAAVSEALATLSERDRRRNTTAIVGLLHNAITAGRPYVALGGAPRPRVDDGGAEPPRGKRRRVETAGEVGGRPTPSASTGSDAGAASMTGADAMAGGGSVVRVSGDGWCVLYAVVASMPTRWWPRQWESSLGTEVQQAAIVRELAAPGRGVGGELGRLAGVLHRMVWRWVRERLEQGGLPAQVVEAYRRSPEQMAVSWQLAWGSNRGELLQWLDRHGVREVRQASWVSEGLRERFIEVRGRYWSGVGAVDGVARAEAEVTLDAHGRLAVDAWGVERQFRFLRDQGQLPGLGELSDEDLRTAVCETHAVSPLDVFEAQQLNTALDRWQPGSDVWASSQAEMFPVLVAHVLGVRLRVRGGLEVGPVDAAGVVEVVYDGGSHYDAVVGPQSGTLEGSVQASRLPGVVPVQVEVHPATGVEVTLSGHGRQRIQQPRLFVDQRPLEPSTSVWVWDEGGDRVTVTFDREGGSEVGRFQFDPQKRDFVRLQPATGRPVVGPPRSFKVDVDGNVHVPVRGFAATSQIGKAQLRVGGVDPAPGAHVWVWHDAVDERLFTVTWDPQGASAIGLYRFEFTQGRNTGRFVRLDPNTGHPTPNPLRPFRVRADGVRLTIPASAQELVVGLRTLSVDGVPPEKDSTLWARRERVGEGIHKVTFARDQWGAYRIGQFEFDAATGRVVRLDPVTGLPLPKGLRSHRVGISGRVNVSLKDSAGRLDRQFVIPTNLLIVGGVPRSPDSTVWVYDEFINRQVIVTVARDERFTSVIGKFRRREGRGVVRVDADELSSRTSSDPWAAVEPGAQVAVGAQLAEELAAGLRGVADVGEWTRELRAAAREADDLRTEFGRLAATWPQTSDDVGVTGAWLRLTGLRHQFDQMRVGSERRDAGSFDPGAMPSEVVPQGTGGVWMHAGQSGHRPPPDGDEFDVAPIDRGSVDTGAGQGLVPQVPAQSKALWASNRAVRGWLDALGETRPAEVVRKSRVLHDVLEEAHWWRLYIDAKEHAAAVGLPDPGWLYDLQQSPGFQQGMMSAYRSVLDDAAALQRPMNWVEYRHMHDMVTNFAPDRQNFEISGTTSHLGFWYVHHHLGVDDGPAADLLTERLDGRQLVVDLAAGEDIRAAPIVGMRRSEGLLHTGYPAEQVPRMVEAVFERYYAHVGRAVTDRGRLRAVSQAVRALHVMHPFMDGNGRLNVYLLLPRLLLANGYRPVISPAMANLFSGGFSVDQIATALRWGQDRRLEVGLDDIAPQTSGGVSARGGHRWGGVGGEVSSWVRGLHRVGESWLTSDGLRVVVQPFGGRREGLLLARTGGSSSVVGESLPEGAGYAVVVHGADDGVNLGSAVRVSVTDDAGADAGSRLLDATQLARILAVTLSGDARRAVLLVACDAGTLSTGGFAQRLADASGRDVLAPVEQVFTGVPDREGLIVGVAGQPWALFEPGGEHGWDVVNDCLPNDPAVAGADGSHRPFDGVAAIADSSHIASPGGDLVRIDVADQRPLPGAQPSRSTDSAVHVWSTGGGDIASTAAALTSLPRTTDVEDIQRWFEGAADQWFDDDDEGRIALMVFDGLSSRTPVMVRGDITDDVIARHTRLPVHASSRTHIEAMLRRQQPGTHTIIRVAARHDAPPKLQVTLNVYFDGDEIWILDPNDTTHEPWPPSELGDELQWRIFAPLEMVQFEDDERLLGEQYGPLTRPYGVYTQERDEDDLVRVNPVGYRLADMSPALLSEHADMKWIYSVDADGDIRMAPEDLLDLPAGESTDLYRAYHRGQAPATTADLQQFLSMFDRHGHPTISVKFDAESGKVVTRAPRARVAGQVMRNPGAGRWEIDAFSGRYMSEIARERLLRGSEVLPWLHNVASRILAQLGVAVTPVTEVVWGAVFTPYAAWNDLIYGDLERSNDIRDALEEMTTESEQAGLDEWLPRVYEQLTPVQRALGPRGVAHAALLRLSQSIASKEPRGAAKHGNRAAAAGLTSSSSAHIVADATIAEPPNIEV